MNTVTTINLAGTAFQIEDPGYAALKRYLDDAKHSLVGNPDAEEILGDIERAIADKCRRFVSVHKNVITTAEAETIVKEMGPVAGASGTEDTNGPAATKPKRLYRIPEGELIAGVANGLAAYFDIDVVFMRIIFVLLLIVTGGGFAFGYLLAWIFIPVAETAKERAAASGEPFNAQEIIDRVKAEYARVENKYGPDLKQWKRDLKQQHTEHLRWKQKERMRRIYARRQGPSALGELLGVVVFGFLAWYGYYHFPQFHDFLDAVWSFFNRVVDTITTAAVNH